MLDIYGNRAVRSGTGIGRRDFLHSQCAEHRRTDAGRLAQNASPRRGETGKGQVGHSDLGGRRPLTIGNIRPEAGGRRGVLWPAEAPYRHQRTGHSHQRVAARDGQAGRQVQHRPQLHP